MAAYGTFDAKNRFSEILDRVENGEEVVITRRGKPIAKLVPMESEADRRERARQAFEWMREMRKGNSLGGDTVRGLIEEGRQ